MYIITVDYEQFKKIKTITDYKVFYVIEETSFVCVGLAREYSFCFQCILEVKPINFDVDFPTAMKVVSL